jgi:hypothetical protein
MRAPLVALTLSASLSFVAPSAGQSLAELARAAEAARKNTADRAPARVYTNDDLPPVDAPPVPLTGAKSPTAAPAPASVAADLPSTPAAGTLPAVSKEAYWRDRMRPLRERLDRARALADDAKRQADALMRSADRCFQIGVVCKDYTDSLRLAEEHKSLVADVARAERDVAALEEEGRRAGVPPGWLR